MPSVPVVGLAMNFAAMATGNAKLMLMSESGGLPVYFTVNPKSVTATKSNSTEGNRGVVTSSFKEAIKATSNIKMVFKGAQLTGAVQTQESIKQLMAWATPQQISAADALVLGSVTAAENLMKSAASSAKTAVTATASNLLPSANNQNTTAAASSTKDTIVNNLMNAPVYYRLPVLLVFWGVGGPLRAGMRANLEKVDVEYERFDWTGIPVWAKVTLTLVEYTEPLAFTNPTSGGPPGRSKHIVTQGDGLVQIATRTYGTPQAWRAVAEANNLDDPLRIKSGRSLALPDRESFTRGGRP